MAKKEANDDDEVNTPYPIRQESIFIEKKKNDDSALRSHNDDSSFYLPGRGGYRAYLSIRGFRQVHAAGVKRILVRTLTTQICGFGANKRYVC